MWLLTHHFTDPVRKVGQVTEFKSYSPSAICMPVLTMKMDEVEAKREQRGDSYLGDRQDPETTPMTLVLPVVECRRIPQIGIGLD